MTSQRTISVQEIRKSRLVQDEAHVLSRWPKEAPSHSRALSLGGYVRMTSVRRPGTEIPVGYRLGSKLRHLFYLYLSRPPLRDRRTCSVKSNSPCQRLRSCLQERWWHRLISWHHLYPIQPTPGAMGIQHVPLF